jgi:hypothetical protein
MTVRQFFGPEESLRRLPQRVPHPGFLFLQTVRRDMTAFGKGAGGKEVFDREA